MTDQPSDDDVMARLRDLSQADGEEATTEATSRDQEAWDLNVAHGSAAAAQVWAQQRRTDAQAKAWDAFAAVLQVVAVIGFIASLTLLIVHVIQAFR